MKLNQLDLIVPDVPAATEFFVTTLGLEPVVAEERFAEFSIDGFTLMLSPDAMVPMEHARGTILHFEVDDVDAAVAKAVAGGAAILRDPAPTDWGTYSALLQGPAESVIDLYRLA